MKRLWQSAVRWQSIMMAQAQSCYSQTVLVAHGRTSNIPNQPVKPTLELLTIDGTIYSAALLPSSGIIYAVN